MRRIALAFLMATGGVVPVSPAQLPPAGDAAGPGIPVTVAAVIRRDVPVLLRNIGTVQAFQTVMVRSRVDGTLDQVFFTEGQEVKRGDRLALIDPRPYAAILAQAQAKKTFDLAQLANARRDLARTQSLARNDFASRQQLDTQTAAVEEGGATLVADDAAIAAAQLNLDFCSITSPLDGRVGLRLVDPGNYIRTADTSAPGIVTIAQIHPIALITTLPQDTLPRLHAAMEGGRVSVYAETPDDRTELGTGELLTTDNAIDQTTGTIKLKAVFPNQDDRLWPGQFVNVRVRLAVHRNALTVPSIAVQRGQGNLYVFVVRPDSTVAVQPVQIGEDDGRIAEITAGLEDGAQVTIAGMSRLQNGSLVVPAGPRPGI